MRVSSTVSGAQRRAQASKKPPVFMRVSSTVSGAQRRAQARDDTVCSDRDFFQHDGFQYHPRVILPARPRPAVFSIQPELRAMAWAGVMLVASGVGIVIRKNIERIGPIALATALGVAAVACYAWVVWRRRRGISSFVEDSILLLGALLLSAGVAYIETRFHLFGPAWPRHFLVLALVHAIGAYAFDSRTLLSLSITALAAWLGIEQRPETVFDGSPETAVRALVCAAIVFGWRLADARYRAARTFERVFEHFAANLALAAGLMLTFSDDTRPIGLLLTFAAAAGVMWHGYARNVEIFVIYAYVYALIALDVFVLDLIAGSGEEIYLLVSSVAAVAGLIFIHGRFRRRAR